MSKEAFNKYKPLNSSDTIEVELINDILFINHHNKKYHGKIQKTRKRKIHKSQSNNKT